MRKSILHESHAHESHTVHAEPEIPISSVATVLVSSEAPEHPIDHAFDGQRGPGATRWIAAQPGEQQLIIAFDTPQTIRHIIVEVEEREAWRTQELQLSVSSNGGETYRQLRCQEFTFHPGATWECEHWAVAEYHVTHVKLAIKPDKGRKIFRLVLPLLFCTGEWLFHR